MKARSRHLFSLFSLLMLIVALGAFVTSAAAQYPPPADSCQTAIEAKVIDALGRTTTNRFAVFVNQRVINVLNIDNSPSGRTDPNGYPIVEIGINQAFLPLLVSAPDDMEAEQTVDLVLEGTDFVHSVRVLRSGVIVTRFPVHMFPPGEYYLSLCGARLVRVEIPEDYEPFPE